MPSLAVSSRPVLVLLRECGRRGFFEGPATCRAAQATAGARYGSVARRARDGLRRTECAGCAESTIR